MAQKPQVRTSKRADGALAQRPAMCLQGHQFAEHLVVLSALVDRIQALQPGLDLGDSPGRRDLLQPRQHLSRVAREGGFVRWQGLDGELPSQPPYGGVSRRRLHPLDPLPATGPGGCYSPGRSDGAPQRGIGRRGEDAVVEFVEARGGEVRDLEDELEAPSLVGQRQVLRVGSTLLRRGRNGGASTDLPTPPREARTSSSGSARPTQLASSRA